MAREPTTHTIRMPKWGLSMQEGTITQWHVKPGDVVAPGAPFCDIETTKITNEFEAPQGGVVHCLLVDADEVVAVGRPIAILAGKDALPAEIDAAVQAAAMAQEAGASPEAASSAVLFVDAGVSRLAYLAAGDPSSDNAVVFLHGFGGDHANWALVQGAVAAAGYRTIALDLPGHGASDKDVGDGTAATLALAVGAAIEAFGLNRIVLVAHSFGALVAARLVRDGGPVFGPVILIAPLGFGSVPNPAYIRGFLGAERRRDMTPVMEMLFAKPALLGRSIVNDALAALRGEGAREALNRIGDRLLNLGPDELGECWDLIGPDWHVIWGDGDIVVPAGLELRTALAERLSLVPDAGHLPHVEASDILSGIILHLLPG